MSRMIGLGVEGSEPESRAVAREGAMGRMRGGISRRVGEDTPELRALRERVAREVLVELLGPLVPPREPMTLAQTLRALADVADLAEKE